ncbi:MAG TPA: O-antigen ligase family protein, partial [Acetobacteraceae bacterium]|nr:O-antigen ligase family protein [Acetobacteraceae bacterium]
IRVDRRRRTRGNAMHIVFFCVTLAATSTTTLLAIDAFCGIEGVTALIRRHGTYRLLGIGTTMVLVPALAAGALFPDQFLEMLGKDPTLTGRAELWAYVDQAIALKPILGWGLLAFWSDTNPVAGNISTALGWDVPQAHNGLLEMLLDVGVVGTSLFVGLWLRSVWIASRCLRLGSREVAISQLICCGGILLVGATESVLVDPAQPAADMMFIVGLMCERTLRTTYQRQQQAASGHAGKPVRSPPVGRRARPRESAP